MQYILIIYATFVFITMSTRYVVNIKLITCKLFWWRGRSCCRDGLGRGSGRDGIGRDGSGGRSRYG